MRDANRLLSELVAAAREFCNLIEGADEAGPDWLERLSCLLPRIHAALVGLRRVVCDETPPDLVPDYELRFDLFMRLHQRLGGRDRYSLEFDAFGKDPCALTGSLADDLTDIYFELRRGLDVLDHDPGNPERALWVWRSSFLQHWGQHLVDAERHLYELEVAEYLSRVAGEKN